VISAAEVAANAVNVGSILLAGRNSVHTWWLGIVGGVLFLDVFVGARLYADATLQAFFVVTSAIGWWRWAGGGSSAARPQKPVRTTDARLLGVLAVGGIAVAAGYGWLLHRFTDAYAPVIDSFVLVGSVLGQFLLVERRVESWWCWLGVNTISVPLYALRGLHLTAALYLVFWVNALVSLRRWRRLAVAP
jgi:nicotinamide mononucleotide transporter